MPLFQLNYVGKTPGHLVYIPTFDGFPCQQVFVDLPIPPVCVFYHLCELVLIDI